MLGLVDVSVFGASGAERREQQFRMIDIEKERIVAICVF